MTYKQIDKYLSCGEIVPFPMKATTEGVNNDTGLCQ